MSLNSIKKHVFISKFGINERDSGRSEVQIALLTNRINCLQRHFVAHKKDHCSKRGLLNMVSHRKKLLNYLKNKNILRYANIIDQLKLRR
ncbi:MAG: 30S ribosomal protein S15 [Buchnera aphidicola (Meitanaphis elongallis)]